MRGFAALKAMITPNTVVTIRPHDMSAITQRKRIDEGASTPFPGQR